MKQLGIAKQRSLRGFGWSQHIGGNDIATKTIK